MVRVIATFLVKPEEVEKVISLAKELVAETRKEKGCASYELMQSEDAQNKLVVLEAWETAQDLDTHSASAHFARLVPAMAAQCEAPPVVEKYIELM